MKSQDKPKDNQIINNLKTLFRKPITLFHKLSSSDRRLIVIGASAVLLVAVLATVNLNGSAGGTADATYEAYETVEVSSVNMAKTLTAAGEITPYKTETIAFSTTRTFRAMCVEEDEIVTKGQHLIAYSDGTYEDATADGVVTSINAPSTGSVASTSNTLALGYTDHLSLDITVPEDEINSIKVGDPAIIVVNADTAKEYKGEITSLKSISTTLLSDKACDASSEASQGGDSASGGFGGKTSGRSGDPFGSQSSTAYYTVSLKMINDGSVLTGMSASCVITISSRKKVTAVPIEAVSFRDDGTAYVLGGDKNNNNNNEIDVETGDSDANYVEITNGLSAGDTIQVPVLRQEE